MTENKKDEGEKNIWPVDPSFIAKGLDKADSQIDKTKKPQESGHHEQQHLSTRMQIRRNIQQWNNSGILMLAYVLLTLLTTGATWWIAKTTRDSLDIAGEASKEVQKQFQLQNRAYLYTNGIIDSTINNEHFYFVEIINYGKSPIVISTIKARGDYDIKEAFFEFEYLPEETAGRRVFLKSEASYKIKIPIRKSIFSNSARNEDENILYVKPYLFLHGEIIYEDVGRNKDVEYDFCLRSNKAGVTLNTYHNGTKEIGDTKPYRKIVLSP